MTGSTPFFDGHNDFLLRLLRTPAPRGQTWLAFCTGWNTTPAVRKWLMRKEDQ